MNFFNRMIFSIKRQISIVLAIGVYDIDRQSSRSSIGAWESLIGPMQMLLFFIAMRIGFKLLRGSNIFAPGDTTDLYFNIVVFIATGFLITFLFRNVAIKSLSGLKLRSPLFYPRVKPLDILLATSINELRALATLSIAILGLVCLFTWSFRLDSPGLAISVYLLTVLMAIGFGLCVIFLAGLNRWVVRIIKRIIQRILIFTSGIFFGTFELPQHVRPFVTWNPVLHSVELFRYSLNNQYPIPDISLQYLVWCSMVLFGFSLILYRTNESMLLESNDD